MVIEHHLVWTQHHFKLFRNCTVHFYLLFGPINKHFLSVIWILLGNSTHTLYYTNYHGGYCLSFFEIHQHLPYVLSLLVLFFYKWFNICELIYCSLPFPETTLVTSFTLFGEWCQSFQKYLRKYFICSI